MRDDFAAMICSHGRAETMTTYSMLRNQGYTGKIIVVIDDEDDQREAYEKNFECVEVFCKEEYYEKSDGVIQGKQKGILYARNACYDIAEKYGLKYFTEFDDDLSAVRVRAAEDGTTKSCVVKNLDELFEAMLEVFKSPKVKSVSALSQGDYIGGAASKGFNQCVRVCNQAFFLMTERRVDFIASMNEDICSCLTYGMRGDLFLGLNGTMFLAEPIGNNTKMGNGMSEFYKKLEPFARSFIGVIVRPDCVVSESTDDSFRIKVKWDYAVPKILNERYKKYA